MSESSWIRRGLDARTAQVIIGACNPQLAHQALSADPRVATLLPCNVVVRADGEHTIIEALDPAIMATVSGTPALDDIARDAAQRIQTALESVHAK